MNFVQMDILVTNESWLKTYFVKNVTTLKTIKFGRVNLNSTNGLRADEYQ